MYKIVPQFTGRYSKLISAEQEMSKRTVMLVPEKVHCVVERISGVTRAVFPCYDEACQYIDHLIAH